jgi:exosortase/archaeosortase family protein
MKLADNLKKKRLRIILFLIFILILAFAFLHLFLFKTNQISTSLSFVFDFYSYLSEKFANQLLHILGSPFAIDNVLTFPDYTNLNGIISAVPFKMWLVLLLCLIWLTKTSIVRRSLFTILFIAVHFLSISIYTAVEVHIAGLKNPYNSIREITYTLGLLIMITIFLYWYWRHKEIILNSLSKMKIKVKFLESDFRFFTFIYMIIIGSSIIFIFFDYSLYVKFLFTSTQKILALLGYEAKVEPFHLVGANGSIYMSKSCLGLLTILLFATIVYFTGNNNKIRWIYIVSGIIFLNIVNILRFVFLFIYIQKDGESPLILNPYYMHYVFDILIYFIVFILWVVWFEKFADINPEKGSQD